MWFALPRPSGSARTMLRPTRSMIASASRSALSKCIRPATPNRETGPIGDGPRSGADHHCPITARAAGTCISPAPGAVHQQIGVMPSAGAPLIEGGREINVAVGQILSGTPETGLGDANTESAANDMAQRVVRGHGVGLALGYGHEAAVLPDLRQPMVDPIAVQFRRGISRMGNGLRRCGETDSDKQNGKEQNSHRPSPTVSCLIDFLRFITRAGLNLPEQYHWWRYSCM
jgi:hypothetical protein